MADKVDNSLPDGDLPAAPSAEETAATERRAFLKRAAIVGLPVILASVRGSTAWGAWKLNASCAGSAVGSRCNDWGWH
jgi:hypothetical protein